MTHKDIYTKFMIEYDKANVTYSYPQLSEDEIAIMLDKAYNAIIAQKITGNNPRGVGFEVDVKVVEDLRPLIKVQDVSFTESDDNALIKNRMYTELPEDDLYFIDAYVGRAVRTRQVNVRTIQPTQNTGMSIQCDTSIYGLAGDTIGAFQNYYHDNNDQIVYSIDVDTLKEEYWYPLSVATYQDSSDVRFEYFITDGEMEETSIASLDEIYARIKNTNQQGLTLYLYPVGETSNSNTIDLSYQRFTFTGPIELQTGQSLVFSNSSAVKFRVYYTDVDITYVDKTLSGLIQFINQLGEDDTIEVFPMIGDNIVTGGAFHITQEVEYIPVGETTPNMVPTKLVTHLMAQKFFLSYCNFPWIKIPIAYVENDTLYIVYDPENKPGTEGQIVYIKRPNTFVKNLNDFTISSGQYISFFENPIVKKETFTNGTITASFESSATSPVVLRPITLENGNYAIFKFSDMNYEGDLHVNIPKTSGNIYIGKLGSMPVNTTSISLSDCIQTNEKSIVQDILNLGNSGVSTDYFVIFTYDQQMQNESVYLTLYDQYYTFECSNTMAEEVISLAVSFALENVESPRLNSKLNMRGLEA